VSRFVGVLFVLAACSGPTVVGDLTIDNIVPNVGPTTAPTAFRIEGKNFARPVRSNVDNGATKIDDIALTVGDQVITDARWVDEATLEGTVPAGMALGQYDVTVRLGARSSVVMNGFTISDTPLTGADGGIDAPAPIPPVLNGLYWAIPCIPGTQSAVSHNCQALPFSGTSVDLPGRATERWSVTVRIRGVMETDTYAGGNAPSAPGAGFYEGALGVALPTEPNENFYGFQVSSPAKVYYLNYDTIIAATALQYDYQATLTVDGNATLTFVGGGTDAYLQDNYNPATGLPYPANGVPLPTDPLPFYGQYAHMQIVSTTLMP
jgi:hypothetical protein